MSVEDKTSRLAGLLYLIVVLTGLFRLAYVPSQINLSGDPQAIANNIRASDSLFRVGIASFLVMQVAFLLLPLVLFRLLRPAGETMAVLMVAFAMVSVPIALVGLADRLDALSMLTDARYATALGPQLQNEALLTLGEYRNPHIHIGEYATVERTVADVYTSDNGNTFLNFGAAFPRHRFRADSKPGA